MNAYLALRAPRPRPMETTRDVYNQLTCHAGRHRLCMQPGTVMATHADTGARLIIDTTHDSEGQLAYHTQEPNGCMVRVHYPSLHLALHANHLL